jgi:hypothetical protein
MIVLDIFGQRPFVEIVRRRENAWERQRALRAYMHDTAFGAEMRCQNTAQIAQARAVSDSLVDLIDEGEEVLLCHESFGALRRKTALAVRAGSAAASQIRPITGKN